MFTTKIGFVALILQWRVEVYWNSVSTVVYPNLLLNLLEVHLIITESESHVLHCPRAFQRVFHWSLALWSHNSRSYFLNPMCSMSPDDANPFVVQTTVGT